MKNYFKFNDISSLDMGVLPTGKGVFGSAEKDYKSFSVPGRNGDLLIFNRYKNVDVTYPAIVIGNDYKKLASDLRAWLLAENGYLKLEDTYNPDEIRLAAYSGPIDLNTILLQAGSLNISFNCKPERYLKSGQQAVEITESGSTIVNPTSFEARPLLVIFGYGSFKINDVQTSISVSTYEHVNIDCDAMICYNGNVNLNQYLVIGDFPTLKAGENTIEFDSTITKIQITPRWWRV
ncbi:MAG: phage tail family protein [Erysipelotrichia bacterium]|nr:phage tail family protein [Erysipelotrichia bacterium]